MFKQGNQYFLGNTELDLHPVSFGERACTPDYIRERDIERYYLIHYVVSGKGVFFTGDTEYEIRPSQIFIIYPGEVYSFSVDKDDPMHYIFLKFRGSMAQKIKSLPRIVTVDGTPLMNMINCNKESNTAEEYITSQLYLFFSQLFEVSQKKNDYITTIKNFISANRDSNITVEMIRKLVNLNRQYLSALFKKETGITIQQYIINTRIEKAKTLLKQHFSITETAALCGYESIYSFSKSFKRVVGIAPSEFNKDK